jgi:hypothetical protein
VLCDQADMVEVLPAKSEAVNCLWHGGALLGVIDPARDAWSVRLLHFKHEPSVFPMICIRERF